MRLFSFTRGLLDNIGVKLIALVVAMVIWFNASGQQETKKDFVGTLSFVNVPDSLTITGRVPDQVRLNVSGTRRQLLFLGFRKVSMLVNMSRATPGRFSQRLSVSDIVLPAGVEPGDVRIVSPQVIDVILDRLVEKRVAVTVTLSGALPDELLLNHKPRAEPEWVVVRGPEGTVTTLEEIPTRAIDLTRIRESVVRRVPLDFDGGMFMCNPASVEVEIAISPRSSRVLANVPPTVLVDSEDYLTEVYPKTVSLVLEGPQAVLDTLRSGDVSVLLDLSGKRPGRYVLAPEVIVPDAVKNHVINVDSLRVSITRG